MTARDEVQRAYDGVLELLADGAVQHMNPHQLGARVEWMRDQHLAEFGGHTEQPEQERKAQRPARRSAQAAEPAGGDS